MKLNLFYLLVIFSSLSAYEIDKQILEQELSFFEGCKNWSKEELEICADFIIEQAKKNSEINLILTELSQNDINLELEETRTKNSKKILRLLCCIRNELTACCTNLENDFAIIFNLLSSLSALTTLTSLAGFENLIINNFSSTFTSLSAIETLIINDFSGTFTVLADIRSTITECCAELFNTLTSVFPCAAIPITQAQIPFTITEPGLYCLAEPVINATASPAITIASDNVTLDLNGNSIDMAGGAGSGVSVGAFENATVKYGNIVNSSSSSGIIATGSSNLLIEQVKTFALVRGIELVSVSNAIIDEVFALSNAITGVAVSASNTITIRDSTIDASPTSNINLSGVTNFTIKNNIITNSTNNSGINIVSSTAGKIDDNLINNNTFGISVSLSSQLAIYNNVFENNFTGIIFTTSSQTDVSNNKIIGSGLLGGIGLNYLGTDVGHTTIGNVLENHFTGISISAGSTRHNIRVNTIIGTGAVGSEGISNAGGSTNIICLNYAQRHTTNYVGVPASLILTPGTPSATYSTDDQFANASNT